MLKTCLRCCLLLIVFGLLPSPGQAQLPPNQFKADLISFEEVPAVSSTATGSFTMLIDPTGTQFTYRLTYSGLSSNVTQAHIHFGQKGVNGGITLFFCTNLGNGPAGTQSCPVSAGTVTGRITAAEITGGAAAQGIAATELAEVLRAIRSGVAYVNVHTTNFPGGEIRGQLVLDGK